MAFVASTATIASVWKCDVADQRLHLQSLICSTVWQDPKKSILSEVPASYHHHRLLRHEAAYRNTGNNTIRSYTK